MPARMIVLLDLLSILHFLRDTETLLEWKKAVLHRTGDSYNKSLCGSSSSHEKGRLYGVKAPTSCAWPYPKGTNSFSPSCQPYRSHRLIEEKAHVDVFVSTKIPTIR